jgi:hypothetical protein
MWKVCIVFIVILPNTRFFRVLGLSFYFMTSDWDTSTGMDSPRSPRQFKMYKKYCLIVILPNTRFFRVLGLSFPFMTSDWDTSTVLQYLKPFRWLKQLVFLGDVFDLRGCCFIR